MNKIKLPCACTNLWAGTLFFAYESKYHTLLLPQKRINNIKKSKNNKSNLCHAHINIDENSEKKEGEIAQY